ncbi:actin-like [Sminthopsis crassicaudata]|uniref:actin-like n=1 Tax=Sminthopsis crassicaudata TaxID=9301 RepID=UPI003D69F2C7
MGSSSVVIDIGSACCKVGLSWKNYPTFTIPAVVGYEPYCEDLEEFPSKIRKVVGLENMHILEKLSITEFPVNRGRILNWEAMEAIWQHAFDSLRVKPKNHPVIVTDLPWKERSYQQKVLEVMMETFNVPSLHIGNQAELAMFGAGFLTGMVLDCGAGLTHIAPILGGHTIRDRMLICEIGGLDISALLYKHLFRKDMRMDNLLQRKAMEELKEKLCYVSKSPHQEPSSNLTASQERVSMLPDGKIISLTEKHCTFPDMLFNPSQFGGTGVKLGLEVLKSAMSCPNTAKDYIFSRVVLSGGSTLFPGFPERLISELNAMKPSMYSTEVVSRPNRIYLPWLQVTTTEPAFTSLIRSTFLFLMEETTLVIDIGSDWCRTGLGGRNHPTLAVPEVVGYQPYPENPGPSNPKTRKIVGSSNLSLLRQLRTEFPVRRREITNWDALEAVLTYSYNHLKLKAEDHPVLLTGFIVNSLNHRRKLMEIMMESFNVPSVHIGNQAELCLFGSGFLTGLVLHSGTGITSISPVCNGRVKELSTKVFEMAGIDVSLFLHKALFNKSMNLDSLSQRNDMDIVKKLCYVSKNPNQKDSAVDSVSNLPGVTALPDGKIINLAKELRTSPDMFFWTSNSNFPNMDLSSEVIETVTKCDIEERSSLFSNVVLSGGNTLFTGFPERLLWELNNIRPQWFPAQVVSRPNRIILSWVGGSIVSCLSSFHSQYLTNKEYQEAAQALGF